MENRFYEYCRFQDRFISPSTKAILYVVIDYKPKFNTESNAINASSIGAVLRKLERSENWGVKKSTLSILVRFWPSCTIQFLVKFWFILGITCIFWNFQLLISACTLRNILTYIWNHGDQMFCYQYTTCTTRQRNIKIIHGPWKRQYLVEKGNGTIRFLVKFKVQFVFFGFCYS